MKEKGAKLRLTGRVARSGRNLGPYLYERIFLNFFGNLFWRGHLRKHEIFADGRTEETWDAGFKLQARRADARNLVTFTALSSFAAVTKEILGVSTDAERDFIVDYIYGGPANPEFWKLGDIFHSDPVAVGSPSPFFEDFPGILLTWKHGGHASDLAWEFPARFRHVLIQHP
jgi:hypothetical protein